MKILSVLNDIPDPRMLGKVMHPLSTILFVTLCGVLSGCETWEDIEIYCEAKLYWLSQYINLDNGIPSSDTFRRVFTLLAPECVETLLRTHAAEVVKNGLPSNQIAVDGKALRGSKRADSNCLYSVSAWCHENGLVLGEKQVEEKSNEITAIPLLLNSIDIKGKTITIDAAGCQKSIAALITDKKGDYVLSLKQNHPKLYDAVKIHINNIGISNGCLRDDFDETHGRLVRRRYFSYDLNDVSGTEDWAWLKSVVAVETISSINNSSAVTSEWRYYLSSHDKSNASLPSYIRNHWGIENKLHWVLDVHLHEDNDKKAERNSTRSFALLKRIALNIVRGKATTKKRSLRGRLKNIGWDDRVLLDMLS